MKAEKQLGDWGDPTITNYLYKQDKSCYKEPFVVSSHWVKSVLFPKKTPEADLWEVFCQTVGDTTVFLIPLFQQDCLHGISLAIVFSYDAEPVDFLQEH